MAVLDPDTAHGSVRTAPSRQARGFVHLRTRADFLRAAKGSRFHTTAFSLQAGPHGAGVENATTMPARFGFTVTKKTAGAVQRNRIRRRLREAVRVTAMAATPGYDYVLVARLEALALPFTQLTDDLVRALQGVHVRRGVRRRAAASTMTVRAADLASISRSGRRGESGGPDQFGQDQSGQDQSGKDQ